MFSCFLSLFSAWFQALHGYSVLSQHHSNFVKKAISLKMVKNLDDNNDFCHYSTPCIIRFRGLLSNTKAKPAPNARTTKIVKKLDIEVAAEISSI